MANLCGCQGCPNGAAQKYKLSVSGTTNNTCTDCANLNGDYILSLASTGATCQWSLTTTITLCGGSQSITWTLSIFSNGGVTLNLKIGLAIIATWSGTITDCLAVATLSRAFENVDCNYPSTITVTPIFPALSDTDLNGCLPAIQKGNAPGSNLGQSFNQPYLGVPGVSGQFQTAQSNTLQTGMPPWSGYNSTSGGGCGGGCGCQGSCGGSCGCQGSCGCGSSSAGATLPVPTPLMGAAAAIAGVQQAKPPIPGAMAGPAKVNLSNGNLVLMLPLPDAGCNNPGPTLTYNSLSPVSSSFGTGWTEAYQSKLVAGTGASIVTITDAAGGVARYSNPSSGQYQPPAGNSSSLVKNADGSYTQTQPDGLQLRFNSSGQLTRQQSASGQRWTMTYVSSRLDHITSPSGQRTSYAYDVSGNLRRITDSGGRITSLTINASGNLARVRYPDLSIVSMTYNAAHRLTAYQDAGGNRTSYSYDGNNFANQVILPSGARTTFTYRDWGTTKVTDARSNVTTLLYNMARNITGTISPVGARTTFTWLSNQLTAVLDPHANRTTVISTTLGNSTSFLNAIPDALGNRYSITYDTNSRVKSLRDQLGNRTTFVWDSSNNRTA